MNNMVYNEKNSSYYNKTDVNDSKEMNKLKKCCIGCIPCFSNIDYMDLNSIEHNPKCIMIN